MDLCRSSSFPNLWLNLYERIRATAKVSAAERKKESQHFHLIFTLMAFEGVDIRQLQILQGIAAYPEEFSQCKAPAYLNFNDVECYEYDPVVIGKVIDSAKIPLEEIVGSEKQKYTGNDFYLIERSLKNQYLSEIKRIKSQLIQEVRELWPCKSIDVSMIRTHSRFLNMNQVCIGISRLLQSWYHNRKLRKFAMKIDEIFTTKLRPLTSVSFSAQPEWKLCDVGTQSFPKYAIDFDAKMCLGYDKYANDIALARRIYENGADEELPLEQLWNRFRQISTPEAETYLIDAQLYPRLLPTTILPRILPPRHNESPINVEQQYLIGALAVVTCREQRELRNARYEQQTQMEVAHRREQENPLHENWQPHEHPEWLLFQIEMDLSIRNMQVTIRIFDFSREFFLESKERCFWPDHHS